MNWDALDYAAALVIIGGAISAYVVFARLTKSRPYRWAAGAGITALAALVWAQLAVGII